MLSDDLLFSVPSCLLLDDLFKETIWWITCPQGVDLVYLQTGISEVFFRVLNYENLYFLVLVTAAVFFGVV